MRLIDADKSEKYLYEHLDDLHMIAAKNAIDEMPTVDAKPIKRAHWEKWDNWIRCSQCGAMAGVNYVELLEGKIKPMTAGVCFCCGSELSKEEIDGRNQAD